MIFATGRGQNMQMITITIKTTNLKYLQLYNRRWYLRIGECNRPCAPRKTAAQNCRDATTATCRQSLFWSSTEIFFEYAENYINIHSTRSFIEGGVVVFRTILSLHMITLDRLQSHITAPLRAKFYLRNIFRQKGKARNRNRLHRSENTWCKKNIRSDGRTSAVTHHARIQKLTSCFSRFTWSLYSFLLCVCVCVYLGI